MEELKNLLGKGPKIYHKVKLVSKKKPTNSSSAHKTLRCGRPLKVPPKLVDWFPRCVQCWGTYDMPQGGWMLKQELCENYLCVWIFVLIESYNFLL